jgi:hypothetical protein
MNFAPVAVVLLVAVVAELTSKAPRSGPLPEGREVPRISFLDAEGMSPVSMNPLAAFGT